MEKLYHFTCTKWALTAIRDRRLKATDPDNANDLFEFFPRQWETEEDRETAFPRRIATLATNQENNGEVRWYVGVR